MILRLKCRKVYLVPSLMMHAALSIPENRDKTDRGARQTIAKLFLLVCNYVYNVMHRQRHSSLTNTHQCGDSHKLGNSLVIKNRP